MLLGLIPCFMVTLEFPNREQRYAFISPQIGPTHAIFKSLCKDDQPIDILILGSSLAMCALDPLILEKELSKQLDRPSVVLNLAIHWRGEEIPFLLLNEILKQREVKMLIWSSPETITWSNEPHSLAFHFWNNERNFKNLRNLPLENQIQYYTGSLLSFPRLAYLALTHGNHFETPIFDMIDNYGPNGGLPWELGFREQTEDRKSDQPDKFIPYHKDAPIITENDLVYSTSSKQNFYFGKNEVNAYQKAFLNKIGKLCHENSIPLVCFKMPTYAEYNYQQIHFPVYWPDHFEIPLTLMGVLPHQLFPNMDKTERRRFYTDAHLNANGQKYLSEAIAPALSKFYAGTIK